MGEVECEGGHFKVLSVEHREEPFVGLCKVHLSMELLAVVLFWGLSVGRIGGLFRGPFWGHSMGGVLEANVVFSGLL